MTECAESQQLEKLRHIHILTYALLRMHSWTHAIQRAEKHALYRAKRHAAMHNPDYINKYANEAKEFARGNDSEAKKRIHQHFEKAYNRAFAVTTGKSIKRFTHK